MLGCIVQVGVAQDAATVEDDDRALTNNLISEFDPCAGSPNEAVCRCALEFPPVTYDTSVPFDLSLPGDRGDYSLAAGRTLMNLIRANVAAIETPSTSEREMRLFVNPPPTPEAASNLVQLVHTNPGFVDLQLVKTLELPRHLGGEPDRLFGSIWWHGDSSDLIITFRGTQTPFEFHLDTLVNNQLLIKCTSTGRPLMVCEGFGTGYLMMRQAILDAIEPYRSRAKRIFIGGHSLGGAIAAIATADLACRGYAPVTGMTFGQPRVFSPETSMQVDQMQDDESMILWRVVNASDPVPAVPPAAVTGNGVKFKHTSAAAIYLDDPSAQAGKGAAWNHHFYYEGYFDDQRAKAYGVVGR